MLFISLKPNSEAGADDMAGEWKHEQTESLFSPECVNGNISMLSFPAFERLQKGHCSLYKIKADKVWCCVLSLAIFNTYILVFLLQLYIYLSSFFFSFFFFTKMRMWHIKCVPRKAGYIGLCPEGIGGGGTERDRALTTLPRRPSHAFPGMRVNIISLMCRHNILYYILYPMHPAKK